MQAANCRFSSAGSSHVYYHPKQSRNKTRLHQNIVNYMYSFDRKLIVVSLILFVVMVVING